MYKYGQYCPITKAAEIWGDRWTLWMRDRIQTDRLPQPRVVLQLNFTGTCRKSFWLILTGEDVSICLTDPGFDLDIVLTADLAAFYQVWLGRLSYFEALEAGQVKVDALPSLAEALPTWFAYSLTAPTVRTAGNRQSVVSEQSMSLS